MLLYCDVTGIEILKIILKKYYFNIYLNKKYFKKYYYNNLNLLED